MFYIEKKTVIQKRFSKQALMVLAIAIKTGEDLSVLLTEDDIVHIAWQVFPSEFGWKKDRKHVDTKAVSILLATKDKGSARMRRWIERPSPGKWRLTPEGLEHARVIGLEIFPDRSFSGNKEMGAA